MSSIAKVKEYLARFGAAGRVMELDHSSATVCWRRRRWALKERA